MPFAATHILFPLVLTVLIRDFYLRKKDKKLFPLHYVLIAGLAGTLPDWDIGFFWILQLSGIDVGFWDIHKTYLHSIFVPIIFFILFFVLKPVKSPTLGKHKLKLNIIALMIALGAFSHIFLDLILGEPFSAFYPFHTFTYALALVNYFPEAVQGLLYPTLDAVLLIFYLIYLEIKHKISDFI
ncbi:MAG: metal-dependent hydrolase [Nanoarchaeota archaeon]